MSTASASLIVPPPRLESVGSSPPQLVSIKAEEVNESVGVLSLSQQFVGNPVKVAFGDLPHSPSCFEELKLVAGHEPDGSYVRDLRRLGQCSGMTPESGLDV
jgi:hypothetical protein